MAIGIDSVATVAFLTVVKLTNATTPTDYHSSVLTLWIARVPHPHIVQTWDVPMLFLSSKFQANHVQSQAHVSVRLYSHLQVCTHGRPSTNTHPSIQIHTSTEHARMPNCTHKQAHMQAWPWAVRNIHLQLHIVLHATASPIWQEHFHTSAPTHPSVKVYPTMGIITPSIWRSGPIKCAHWQPTCCPPMAKIRIVQGLLMIVIILIVLVPLWVSFVLTVIVMMMRLSWCMTVWCPCCDHATCYDD